MRGRLSEFTLAQLLQFFALAERSGTIVVRARGSESRLLVEGDRIIGWGLEDYDPRESLLRCEMLPTHTRDAIRSVLPRDDTPGLSFVVRNLVEPERWESFTQRQIEQDIYPLLSLEDGEFDVHVARCPPAPLRLSIQVNSLILEGSRWESEMEAAELEGYALDSRWRRANDGKPHGDGMSALDWMAWAALARPARIGEIAERICMPDLTAINSVKRLRLSDWVVPDE